MEHLSAMAIDTPSMVKNKLFSMHASRVFSEVQKLNLSTVQEREAEYAKRMMALPNHILSNESNEPEKVRYTFSMPKKTCISGASISSSMSGASSMSIKSSASSA